MIKSEDVYKDFVKKNNISDKEFPYKVYNKLIRIFNKEVMKQVIIDGKTFNMSHLLGTIQAIEVERKIKISKNGKPYTSINWNESKKLKQKIINEGGTPLEVIKDDKGNIIDDNGGKQWYVYDLSPTKPDFYWNRLRRKDKKDNDKPFYPLKNIKYYNIIFTTVNHRALNSAMFTQGITYSKGMI